MIIELNPASSVPLYKQIVEQIRKQLARGVLVPGDKLPTVRALAVQCRVNRNTAARAVQILEAEGVVYTRVGKGSFIAEGQDVLAESARSAALETAVLRLIKEADELGVNSTTLIERIQRVLQDRSKPSNPSKRGGHQ